MNRIRSGLRRYTTAKFTKPRAASGPPRRGRRLGIGAIGEFCGVPRNFLRLHTVEGLWQASRRRSMATSFSDAADGIE
jgi:hypothetical protein